MKPGGSLGLPVTNTRLVPGVSCADFANQPSGQHTLPDNIFSGPEASLKIVVWGITFDLKRWGVEDGVVVEAVGRRPASANHGTGTTPRQRDRKLTEDRCGFGCYCRLVRPELPTEKFAIQACTAHHAERNQEPFVLRFRLEV